MGAPPHQVSAATKIEALVRGAAVRRLKSRTDLLLASQPKTWWGRLREAWCGCLEGKDTHALFLFPPNHPARRLALALVTQPLLPGTPITFGGLVVCVILLSASVSVFETCEVSPRRSTSPPHP